MPVDPELALRLAHELSLIPDCPRSDPAVEKLARDLVRLCSDDAEASAIVTEACDRWERWLGPHGLVELMESKHPEPPPSNQAKDYGPRPKPDCETCADWGYFTGSGGKVEWCSCTAGFETLAKEPGLVDALNRKDPLGQRGTKALHEPREDRPKITQADVDRLLEARKSRNE